MHPFKDRDNNTWQIDLTVGSVLRVKQESGGKFDLFDPDSKVADGRPLTSIVFADKLSDYAELWELIYHIVGPSMEEKSAEAFGKAMAGDCLLDAQRALIEEWRDFFRGLRRMDLVTVLEKRLAYQNRALELIAEKAKDPRIAAVDARVEAKMQAEYSSSLGGLAESLDSILGPSPSAS